MGGLRGGRDCVQDVCGNVVHRNGNMSRAIGGVQMQLSSVRVPGESCSMNILYNMPRPGLGACCSKANNASCNNERTPLRAFVRADQQ